MLDIQKHGRWKSLTVFSYVGTTPEEQLAVTTSFFKSDEVTDVQPVVEDAVPSIHARALRAAGAKKKIKNRGTKRARSPVSDPEGDDEEEEDTAEQKAEEENEDWLFEAQCAQGYREGAEKARYTPRRDVKTAAAAAAAAAKSKESKRKGKKSE